MSKEIWIRSADGDELLLCCGFEVMDDYLYAYTVRDFEHACDYIVQKYATHERAMEVLDEIQRFLTPKILVPAMSEPYNKDEIFAICREWRIDNIAELNNNGVFQLPKE